MKIPRFLKLLTTITLSLVLSHVPNAMASETLLQEGQMISTAEWVSQETREQLTQKVTTYLNKDDVKQQLMLSGISSEEASLRIASLNNEELKDLSAQIDEAKYGGDILIAILVVVLIIFLIKRI
jgi:hypothetical protein